MKLPFLPIHIITTETFFDKLQQAKQLGKSEEFRDNQWWLNRILKENAWYRKHFGGVTTPLEKLQKEAVKNLL